MSEPLPISKDSEICQVLTCIPEKFVVDFANGIDVAHDHLHVQKSRGGFFARCYDGFTGKSARRQTEINASLVDGVEASLNWLTDLSESLARSNLAIARVNDRVSELKLNIAEIANYSADTRQQLQILAERLGERCHAIEQKLARIDFTQRAQLNLEQVFNKWRAGRYNSFSLSGRCYAALEELRWGDFGDFCRSQSGQQSQLFIDDLKNRAIAQLAHDASSKPSARLDTRQWLARPSGRDVLPDANEALAYIGDCFDQENYPFIFSTSQASDQLPQEVPRLSSAERITEALVSEVFGGAAYA